MGLFSSLLPAVGGIAGGFFGGPAGAMMGSQIGSGIGGAFNQRSDRRASQRTQQDAQNYLNQINGIGKQYLEPYIQPGMDAGNRADQEYSRLLDDPTGFINAIMSSYKPSEGYQFKENHLRRGAANTSAAGGFAGTQYDSENQASLVNALLSDDMQNYLNNILGAHGTGLAGKETVAGRGFNAASNLTDFLGSNLSQQAGLTYNAGNARNADRANYNNSMLNLGGSLAGTIGQRYFPQTPPSAGRGGAGPATGGYGGPYRSTAPGAAWMR